VIGRGSAHIVLAGHPHGSNDSSDCHHSASPETVLRVALDSSGRSIQAVNKSRQHIAALAPLLGESYVPPLETVVVPKEAYPMIDSKTPKKSKSRPNKEVSGGTNENNSQIRSSEWGLLAPNLMSMWLPLPNGAEDHRRLLVGEQTRRNEEAMIESEVSRGGSSKNTALLRPYSEVYGHASLGTGRSAASSCCPQVVTVELKPKAAMEAAARSLLVGLATVIHDDGNDDGGGTCASRSEELDDEEDALGAFVEGNGRTASSFDSKRPSNATIAYRFTADHDVKFRHSRFDMTQAQKLLGTHTSATKQRSEFKPADLFAVAAAAAAAAAEASASSSFPSPLPGGDDDDGDDDGDGNSGKVDREEKSRAPSKHASSKRASAVESARGRVESALVSLVRTPQNNLRVFVDGAPYDLNSSSENPLPLCTSRSPVMATTTGGGDNDGSDRDVPPGNGGSRNEEEMTWLMLQVLRVLVDSEPQLLRNILNMQRRDVIDVEGARFLLERLARELEGSDGGAGDDGSGSGCSISGGGVGEGSAGDTRAAYMARALTQVENSLLLPDHSSSSSSGSGSCSSDVCEKETGKLSADGLLPPPPSVEDREVLGWPPLSSTPLPSTAATATMGDAREAQQLSGVVPSMNLRRRALRHALGSSSSQSSKDSSSSSTRWCANLLANWLLALAACDLSIMISFKEVVVEVRSSDIDYNVNGAPDEDLLGGELRWRRVTEPGDAPATTSSVPPATLPSKVSSSLPPSSSWRSQSHQHAGLLFLTDNERDSRTNRSRGDGGGGTDDDNREQRRALAYCVGVTDIGPKPSSKIVSKAKKEAVFCKAASI